MMAETGEVVEVSRSSSVSDEEPPPEPVLEIKGRMKAEPLYEAMGDMVLDGELEHELK